MKTFTQFIEEGRSNPFTSSFDEVDIKLFSAPDSRRRTKEIERLYTKDFVRSFADDINDPDRSTIVKTVKYFSGKAYNIIDKYTKIHKKTLRRSNLSHTESEEYTDSVLKSIDDEIADLNFINPKRN